MVEVSNVPLPIRILYYGPAGCGKTLLAKALCGESATPVVYTNAGDFFPDSKLNLEAAFESVAKNKAALVIEDIDELFAALGGGDRFNVIKELQDFRAGYLFIATTRRPDALLVDEIGIFDELIPLPYPNREDRRDIIEKLTPAVPLSATLKERIAENTDWWSPAELKALVEHGWNGSQSKQSEEKLTAEIDRISRAIPLEKRKSIGLELLEFTRLHCPDEQLRRGIETRFETLDVSSKRREAGNSQETLKILRSSEMGETEYFSLHLNSAKDEVPEPTDRATELDVICTIRDDVEKRPEKALQMDFEQFSLTPWIAFQLGHISQGKVHAAIHDDVGSSFYEARIMAEVAVKVAKICQDETRVYANLLDLLALDMKEQNVDQAINVCQEIIDYPTRRGLNERCLAHLDLVSLYASKEEWEKARYHLEMGVRCLGQRLTGETRQVVMHGHGAKIYTELKDPLGALAVCNDLGLREAESKVRNGGWGERSLEQALAYSTRLHSMGMNSLARVVNDVHMKTSG